MKKILIFMVCLMLFATNIALAESIVVISREDGSGTRAAFVELSGVQTKDANGNKHDNTSLDAEIVNSTSAVIASVSSDPMAIAYISMGALSDEIKPLKIEGIEPSANNILVGEYKLFRPFNIVSLGDISTKNDPTCDLLNFILSIEGQKIVENNGYIALPSDYNYQANTKLKGKIVCGGSSSVTPIMEKLIEAYKALNQNVDIELQISDSSTGISNTIDKLFDIGMASRSIKQSELDKGIVPLTIANDGIVVIVNKENAQDNISMEQLKNVFTGEITNWNNLN